MIAPKIAIFGGIICITGSALSIILREKNTYKIERIICLFGLVIALIGVAMMIYSIPIQ